MLIIVSQEQRQRGGGDPQWPLSSQDPPVTNTLQSRGVHLTWFTHQHNEGFITAVNPGLNICCIPVSSFQWISWNIYIYYIFFIKKCVFKTIPIIIIALWHNCMTIQLICTPKSHYHNVKNIYHLNKQRYCRICCITFTSQKGDAINKETYKKYIIR